MSFYENIGKEFFSVLQTIPQIKCEHPEIELRFGTLMDNGNFISHINKDEFFKILNVFKGGNSWSKTYCNETKDYFRRNLRMSQYECNDKKKIECIRKVKLGSSDIKNDEDKFDIRMSICTETPCEIPEDIDLSIPLDNQNFDTIRCKKRYSFIYKNIWRYDFTIVNKEIYEIEIELIDPMNTLKIYKESYLTDSLILKIKDIVELKHNLKQ